MNPCLVVYRNNILRDSFFNGEKQTINFGLFNTKEEISVYERKLKYFKCSPEQFIKETTEHGNV